MISGPLRLAAPAKLNLSLAVVGRRQDGMHELAGVMVLLDLADDLLLLPGCSGLRVSGTRDGVPVAAEANLAWRGLAAGIGGAPDDCCLTLDKRIPAAAGLGGGSSDAAAAWRLGRRWRGETETLDADLLAALAAIGADVPFFAAGAAAARVEGVGERVISMVLPADLPREVVLARAGRLSTAAVFAELRPDEWTGRQPQGSHPSLVPDALPGPNDLLPAALRLVPELDEVRAAMASAGVEPHLTGSGPTLFALVDDPERADAAAHRLARPGIEVLRTRLRSEAATIEPFDEVADEQAAQEQEDA